MKRVLMTACALLPFALSACAGLFSKEQSLPSLHPEQVAGAPSCTECHEGEVRRILKPYASFNHTADFVKGHRFPGAAEQALCALCHRASFCNDCHANKAAMTPAVRFGNRPDRELPHRGDYLTLHRIEGKVDPASCYRCHGKGNNERCRACHRP